jgi:ComF family protein
VRVWESIRCVADAALEVLAPRRCLGCEALDFAGPFFCAQCGNAEPLLDVSGHLDDVPVFAGVRYAEPVVSAIHRFKYGSSPELARALCSWSARSIDLLGIEASDVWVPVPLHPLRLAERGYNQSALLARELSRLSHGPMEARRLQRLRNTEQQVKRGRRARDENVASAFVARTSAGGPRSVVLVDDVVTTGATLRACIAALRAAGDRVVGCVAAARASSSVP